VVEGLLLEHAAALVLEYIPAAQAVHDVAPTPAYIPAGQPEQPSLEPAGRCVPASQKVEQALAPLALNWPTVQLVQNPDAALAENWPATHFVHAIDAILFWNIPTGQLVHSKEEPVKLWYFPLEQILQLVEPGAAENFPAAQVPHEAPPGLDWYEPGAHREQAEEAETEV